MINIVLCHGSLHKNPPWQFFRSSPISIDICSYCAPDIVHDLNNGMPNIIPDNSTNIILAYCWPQLHKIKNYGKNYQNKMIGLIGNIRIKSIKRLSKIFPKNLMTSGRTLRKKIIVNDKIDCISSYYFNEILLASISKKLKIGGYFVFNHSGWNIEMLDYVMKKFGFCSAQSDIQNVLGTNDPFHDIPDNSYKAPKIKLYYRSKLRAESSRFTYYPHQFKCYVKIS